MAGLKALAKETAIYGMSSIIGRFLNYLLVPIYTNALPVESGGYGVITNMYAITALLMVLLTYGMETGFFRFANKGVDDPMRVYSTTLLSVGATAVLFLIVCLSFLYPIAGFLGYGEHPWYMGMMLIVVAMDAFQAIPFAYLRYKKRPVKFAALKLLFIFASIVLNIAYFVGMKNMHYASVKWICFLLFVVVGKVAMAEGITSPDGNLRLEFTVNALGEPVYQLFYKEKAVVNPSKLDLELVGDPGLMNGFTLVEAGASTFDETWKPVWGEVSQIRNQVV